METKKIRYQKLIEEAKASYPLLNPSGPSAGKGLFWHKYCREINLWTYWQGRGQLDAKLMLVGQDWGNPWDQSLKALMDCIHQQGSGPIPDYMEKSGNLTDWNLAKLFHEIGYDITKPCRDLFFTNFVLGCRNYNISGGFRKEWARHDEPYFYRLVNIIEPSVVLCLGKATFCAVLHSFGLDKQIRVGRYNTFIEGPQNPVEVMLPSGKQLHVFALAHCGAIGTMNRNRGSQFKTGLELQIEDWKRIKKYL